MTKLYIDRVEFSNDDRRIVGLRTNDKEFVIECRDIIHQENNIEVLTKKKVKDVIDKLEPKKISGVYKGTYNDARVSFEYYLALEDLKKELGL